MPKTIILNLDKCVGCGACVVACQDQNDLYPEQGLPALRRIYQIEENRADDGDITYASAGCRHCEDSPCFVGCPTGAIYRDDVTHAVRIDRDRCIGCHSCALACPFGVPRYDADDHLYKCDLCSDRVQAGLEPACVRVCPFEALRYEDANDVQVDKERNYLGTLVNGTRGARDIR
ncbi:MAG: 4Fe-4S dicluster domain-containing protein [Planctomycetaceae bacterium]|nr:4Fe-4S dicluster domain-containing protein [Planctomycetaceae bacterium]